MGYLDTRTHIPGRGTQWSIACDITKQRQLQAYIGSPVHLDAHALLQARSQSPRMLER